MAIWCSRIVGLRYYKILLWYLTLLETAGAVAQVFSSERQSVLSHDHSHESG